MMIGLPVVLLVPSHFTRSAGRSKMAAALTSRCMLPASPNWFCSSGSDCSPSGVYAFAAKRCVYLLDVTGDVPTFKGQFIEHTDRVSSVSFCPHGAFSNLCASGADDKSVRIWDIETGNVIASHTMHKAKVTSISWSPVAPNLILSGDEKGVVIAWCYDKNVVYSSCPVQEGITCVAAAFVTDQEAAVGYKSGLIMVIHVDEQGMRPLHRLRGHDSDVQSMAWCPVMPAQLDLGPLQDKALDAQGHLLVSASKDQTIRIWDTLNGKLISVLTLPKKSSQKWRDKSSDWQGRDRLWVSVCWPPQASSKIVSSSHGGDVLLWDLGASDVKDQVQTFGQGHSRIVFNITSSPCGTKIMTSSMDRQVIVWDLTKCQSICTIPSLGGFVYAMAISPLDPGTLALGVGDNMIRVWQTASALGPYDALTLWQGIKSKVMMVRWHPHKEGLLGFGTDDGQVGIYNILSKGKPEVFATYHKKTVYSLSWGPPCPAIDGGDSSACHLYACGGEGSVLEHRPGHPIADAIDVNALIKTTNDVKRKLVCRTDVSWTPDGTAMALGNDDGSIEIFVPPSLRQVCIISVHKKSITCLAWHHGYSNTSTGEDTFHHWLASGSNETTIHVHDVSKALVDPVKPSECLMSITSSTRQLIGHSGRVTALSWSPHHADRLVSSSYDGSAQVWDVDKSQGLANFRGHVGRVMSVCCSYLDPDVVYSGGEDGTARPWRISEQTHTHPPVTERHAARGGSKSSKNKKKSKSRGKEKERGDNEIPADVSQLELTHSEYGMTMITDACTPNEPTSEGRTDIVNGSHAEAPYPSSTESVAIAVAETVTRQTHSEETTPSLNYDWRARQQSNNKQQPVDSNWRANPLEKALRTESDVVENAPQALKGVAPSPMDSNWRIRTPQDTDVSSVISADDDTSSTGTAPSRDDAPFHFVPKIKSDTNKKKKKVKSMFPLSAVADNKSKMVAQQECVTLAHYLNNGDCREPESASQPGEASLVNLGFFADRSSAYKMLVTEGEHHGEASNLDYHLQLEVWKGNLAGALEMAVKERQLNDWLVALSPLAGQDVWLATAELFADQLATQGSHQKAVLYYLACHKVYSAINVYSNQAMYREAVALAKVRLSPSDPVLHDLYTSWAKKLETENAYEQAAKCYLAVNLPADAVRILSIRGDLLSLSTALQVALICSQHQLATSIAVRVLHLCLGTGNWSAAHKAVKGCHGVEGHLMALCTHEVLVQWMTGVGLLQGSMFTDSSPFIMSERGIGDKVPEGNNNDNTKTSRLVLSILEAWNLLKVMSADPSVLRSASEQLQSYTQSSLDENLTMQKLLVRLSYDTAHALLSGVLQDPVSCVSSLLHTLQTCMKNDQYDLVKSFCEALLPQGRNSLYGIIKAGRSVYEGTLLQPENVEEICHELYEYIYAYYLMVMLYKIWWREPGLLESKESLLEIEAEKSPGAGEEIENQNTNSKVDPLGKKPLEKSSATSDGKTPIPFSHFTASSNVYDFLVTIRKTLLTESVARKKALKKQLSEVRKAVVLLRSKKILESVAAAGCGAAKKKGDRKSREGDRKSKRSSATAPESADKSSSDVANDDASLAECDVTSHGMLPLAEEESGSDVISDASTIEAEGTARQSTEGRNNEEGRVSKEADSIKPDSPLEMRYHVDSWTLEDIEHEEQRLLQQLNQHKYKDLPSPDPVEAAMVMGYLCCHPDGLQVGEPATLYWLGVEIAQWALEHAQWSEEITCLERRMDECSKRLLVLLV